jgi:hypothetical protein
MEYSENPELFILVALLISFLFGVVCCYACAPTGWSTAGKRTRDQRPKKTPSLAGFKVKKVQGRFRL